MGLDKIKITGNNDSGSVIINGHDLSDKVKEVHYTHIAGTPPCLTVIILVDEITIKADEVKTYISEQEISNA